MDWLTQVARHHSVYIGYVKGMGISTQAEDIVQECYLRLYKYSNADKCITEGKVNKHYVWRVLYSLCNDYRRDSKRFSIQSLEDADTFISNIEYEQQDTEMEEAFERFINKTLEEVNKLDDPTKFPYNKELLNLYVYSDMSYRSINAATSISTSSIYNTMKQCKEYLREQIAEDFEDFNNQQYDLI